MMDEREFLTLVFEYLKSGGLLSVVASAILLKKYVINGSISRFFEMKKQEIDALLSLREGLLNVISHQEKLNDLLRFRDRESLE